MALDRPGLRDDLERVLEALDHAPHTRAELAEATGIAEDHLDPRLDALRDRGWVARWGGAGDPVLALTWPGRYRLHRARFRAAALASLALGLGVAAALAAWAAAVTTAGPVPPVAGAGKAWSKWAWFGGVGAVMAGLAALVFGRWAQH